jgi:CHAT domain-containing protein
MTGLVGPVVTVTSVPHPGGTKLTFVANRNRWVRPFVHIIPGRSQLDSARQLLDEELTNVRDALATLDGSPGRGADAYRRLRALGRSLVYELFGCHQGVIEGLRLFWRSAVPTWPNPGAAPLVECIGDEAAMLPLELMPFFRMGGPDEAANRYELVQGCRDFVGFSCIVWRRLMRVPASRAWWLRRDEDGRVPIRYLYHDGLVGAGTEHGWFIGRAGDHVALEGPYPGSNENAPTLPEQIYDPSLLLGGGRRALPDQIQHFSCHCYASPGIPPRKFEIELRGSGREIRITLNEIGTQLISFIDDARARPTELPLVFMNACGSSVLRATNSVSFPATFLENGNRGFVGSEISIPDDVATVFSRFVYERLLLQSQPLGAAILGARIELLERYGNPLGIAYTAYADPELRVEPGADVAEAD